MTDLQNPVTAVFKWAAGGNNLSTEEWDALYAELVELAMLRDESGWPMPPCSVGRDVSPWTQQQGECCVCICSSRAVIDQMEADPNWTLIVELPPEEYIVQPGGGEEA